MAKAVIGLYFAIRQVGCKAQQRNQAVEPHSEIVPVEPSDPLTHQETGQLFATRLVGRLRPRAPIAIAPRFVRRVAAAWDLQISHEIRRHSEMQVVARLDLQAAVAIEQPFETARGGRQERQAAAGASSPLKK